MELSHLLWRALTRRGISHSRAPACHVTPLTCRMPASAVPGAWEEAENHRWVNSTLLTVIHWNSVIERCKRAHQKEALQIR